jgi:predicted acyl esterase
MRVQVSSGAFPRYDRNCGTGEPRATATTLQAAQQQVFHDAQHPSAIILPGPALSLNCGWPPPEAFEQKRRFG